MLPQLEFKLVRTPPGGWRLEFSHLPVYVVGRSSYTGSSDRAPTPRPLFLIATGEAHFKISGAVSSIMLLHHQHTEHCSALWPVAGGELFDMLSNSILISPAGKKLAAAVQELHAQREAA